MAVNNKLKRTNKIKYNIVFFSNESSKSKSYLILFIQGVCFHVANGIAGQRVQQPGGGHGENSGRRQHEIGIGNADLLELLVKENCAYFILAEILCFLDNVRSIQLAQFLHLIKIY